MDKAKKILIAEDNAEVRRILSMRLEINGFNVVSVENGEEALKEVKKEKPDLIMLDLMMPKINGFETCRMLKFDDKYKDIPIIVLSALDQQGDREKAVENGADAYFIKPFDLELLTTKIRSLVG